MNIKKCSIGKLLNLLNKRKFTDDFDILCDELIHRGVYPNLPSTKQKAMYYGAYWFIFDNPQFCVNCSYDLRDHEHGPPFKKEVFDSIKKFYICPQCAYTWKGNYYNEE